MKLRRIVGRGAGAILLALFVVALLAYWTSTNDCDRITAARGDVMRAIVYCDYGAPDVLRLETVAKPACTDDQILIRVRAASVNPLEWHYMRGTPYVGRVMGMGLRKPRVTRLGVDVAGQVEAVGRNVMQFKPGDEVRLRAWGPSRVRVCLRARAGHEAWQPHVRAGGFCARGGCDRAAGPS